MGGRPDLTTGEERAEHRAIADRIAVLDGMVYRKQALTAAEKTERARLERRRSALIKLVRERRSKANGRTE